MGKEQTLGTMNMNTSADQISSIEVDKLQDKLKDMVPEDVASGIEEMECTICMESIDEETLLPCQCKLHYCQSCWDKALANSFSQCGQARCPSCRSLVRVDFDPETNRMVFSKETMDMTRASQDELIRQVRQEYLQMVQETQSEPSNETFQRFVENHEAYQKMKELEKSRTDIISRLRHQAMPALQKGFQIYGEANPSLQEVHANASEALAKSSISDLKELMKVAKVDTEGLEKSELIGRLVERTDKESLVGLWASEKCPAPKCVCHSTLQRVGGVERFRQSLGEQAQGLTDDEVHNILLQQQLRGMSHVICDICEGNVHLAQDSFVWTCENRNSTILHATSYDICDHCFLQWTCEGGVSSQQ